VRKTCFLFWKTIVENNHHFNSIPIPCQSSPTAWHAKRMNVLPNQEERIQLF